MFENSNLQPLAVNWVALLTAPQPVRILSQALYLTGCNLAENDLIAIGFRAQNWNPTLVKPGMLLQSNVQLHSIYHFGGA